MEQKTQKTTDDFSKDWETIKKLFTFDLEEKTEDRIRFFITFLLIGFFFVILGDGLYHVSFKGSGVIIMIVGCISIISSIVIPIAVAINE